MYDRKIGWSARQTDELEADFIGYQEVFHPEAFNEMLDRSSSMRSSTRICPGSSGDRPVVGLASKFPVLSVRSIADIPVSARSILPGEHVPIETFSRPVLLVELEVFGVRKLVGVTHMKSKLPIIHDGEDPKDPLVVALGELRALIVRGVEATGIRHIFCEERRRDPRPTILLGDANDAANAVTTRIICGRDPWIGESLEDKVEAWSYQLWDTIELIQRRSLGLRSPYTHTYAGRYERMDGITVSREFMDGNPDRVARLVGAHCLNDHLEDYLVSGRSLPPWKSDHGQLRATFSMEKKT